MRLSGKNKKDHESLYRYIAGHGNKEQEYSTESLIEALGTDKDTLVGSLYALKLGKLITYCMTSRMIKVKITGFSRNIIF
mgnify:CR=1 FL=1